MAQEPRIASATEGEREGGVGGGGFFFEMGEEGRGACEVVIKEESFGGVISYVGTLWSSSVRMGEGAWRHEKRGKGLESWRKEYDRYMHISYLMH